MLGNRISIMLIGSGVVVAAVILALCLIQQSGPPTICVQPGLSEALRCESAMRKTVGAVFRYGKQVGEWPESIEALYPKFLPGPPPRCPLDFVKDRASYHYQPPQNSDLPVLTCERHLKWDYCLYIPQWGERAPRVWRKRPYLDGLRRAPSAEEAQRAFDQCKAVLISVAQALGAFKGDTGSLPRRLEELRGRYMSELPHCPRDFWEGRTSYLYRATGEAQIPVITCERHWYHGYDLLIDRELHVRKVKKRLGLKRPPSAYDWRLDSVVLE